MRARHVVLAGLAALTCCRAPGGASAAAPRVPGDVAERGRELVARGAYGCSGCHAIPGLGAPQGIVAPPLGGMARRAFIAGQLPNSPEVLVAFLQDPPALVANTGMPNVRLGITQARDIAAYLYTLEPPHAP